MNEKQVLIHSARNRSSHELSQLENEGEEIISVETDKQITSDNDPERIEIEEQFYQVYKRRWVMLVLFGLLSYMNAVTWITFAPIAIKTSNFYGISLFWVNALSIIFMLVYVPGIYLGAWVLDHLGLRMGVIVGAVLTGIGAAIRGGGVNSQLFPVVFVGQTVLAAAQVFILETPPKLSANWFGPSQRSTATSIGLLFNNLGIASGFLISPSIVHEEGDLPLLLWIEGGMCAATALIVILFFRGEPPTSPSASYSKAQVALSRSLENSSEAGNAHTSVFFNTLWQLSTHVQYLILLFPFGVGIGGFYAISTLLDQILHPYHYSEQQTGFLGMLMVIVGVGGSFIAGVVADLTKHFKLLIKLCFFGMFGSFVWFFLEVKEDNYTMLCICSSVMGFFMTAILPLCLEMAVECTYPIPEAIAAGLMLLSAQVFGILFTIFMSYAEGVILFKVAGADVDIANWGVTAATGLAFLLVLFFNGRYLRMEADPEYTKKRGNVFAYLATRIASVTSLHAKDRRAPIVVQ